MSYDSQLDRFFKKHVNGLDETSLEVMYGREIKEPLVTLIGGLEDDMSEMSDIVDKLLHKMGHGDELLHYVEELERLCEQARSREL